MKLLDTCFLINLQREMREGFEDSMAGEALLRPYRWLPLIPEVARKAGQVRRELRLSGNLIGDIDILIAATA